MLVQISSSEYKVTVKQKLSKLIPPIKDLREYSVR